MTDTVSQGTPRPPSEQPAIEATSVSNQAGGQSLAQNMKSGLSAGVQAFLSSPVRAAYLLVLSIAALSVLVKLAPIPATMIWRTLVKPEGYIFVNSPEVYTRESLVNDRLKEDHWLNQKLEEADDDANLVGLVRTSTEKLELGEPSANTPAASRQGAGNLNPASSLTFDQKIRIKSANRDFVLQKIIENRLDDRHDLNGNSLYILKFDTTVISHQYSNRKALITIQLVPPVKNATEKSGIGVTSETNLLSDPQSNLALGKAFLKFQLETTDRVNTAITKTLGDRTPTDPASLKKEVIQAIAENFGLTQRDVKIIAALPPSKDQCHLDGEALTETTRCQDWQMEIGPLAEFINFAASVKFENGFAKPPAFKKRENFVSFKLSRPLCKDTSAARSGDLGSCDLRNENKIRTPSHHPSLDGILSMYESGTQCGTAVFSVPLDTGYDLFSDRNNSVRDQNQLFSILSDAALSMNRNKRTVTHFSWGHLEVGTKDGCARLKGSLNKGFLKFVKTVEAFNSYSYSVMPHQSAVSVVDEVMNSASARLATSGKGGFLDIPGLNLLSMNSSNQVSGSSIRSKITAFGYALHNPGNDSGSAEIGWIIDPSAGRVRIDDDGMDTTAESVLAIVSVPAWWPKVQVRVNRRWLNSNGTYSPAREVDDLFSKPTATALNSARPGKVSGNGNQEEESEKLMTVDLPNSQEAIENSLVGNDSRRPSATDVECLPVTTDDLMGKQPDQANAKPKPSQPRSVISCIISGKRLWRNTVVTLGTSQHMTLQVLPNMDGLIAKFEAAENQCSQTLRVWTSEGVAEKKLRPISADRPELGCSSAKMADESSLAAGNANQGRIRESSQTAQSTQTGYSN